jgi:endo-1,4-beta-xylanase
MRARFLALRFALAASVVASLIACGSRGGTAPSPTPSPSPRLRDLARGQGLDIGAFPDGFDSDVPLRTTLAREFSMLTIPVYWCTTEATRGQLDFATPDTLAAFAAQNGMAVRGHPLVYQECVPPWLEEGRFSRDEVTQMLHDHVQAIASRYRGRVRVWDVVNEALTWDGSTANALMLWGTVPINRNVFSLALGPEYIEMAFRWAHEADTEARLFYNDYGTEGTTQKANRTYELVRGLRERGVPIHGVGFQTHISIYRPLNEGEFTATLARFADLGVELQITEMDVDINESAERGPVPLPPEPELSHRLRLQADAYASAMRACQQAPRCTGFTTWGVGDAHTWLDWFGNPDHVKRAPLLFDTGYMPKPAHQALYDLLESRPRRY